MLYYVHTYSHSANSDSACAMQHDMAVGSWTFASEHHAIGIAALHRPLTGCALIHMWSIATENKETDQLRPQLFKSHDLTNER
jgi:hypothetical protein